jgi:hypothetical protein
MRHVPLAQLLHKPVRLRPSTSLGQLPAPVRVQPIRLEQGFVAWGSPPPGLDHGVEELEPAPLPDEFVFHELWDLPLLPRDWTRLEEGALDQVLAFCHDFGVLWRPHARGNEYLDNRTTGGSLLDRRIDHFQLPRINHLADVVGWLRDMQACVRHLVAVANDDYTDHWWDIVQPIETSEMSVHLRDREEVAHVRFCDRLNEGLKQYTAGIETPMLTGEEWWSQPRVDLYGAVCLMLHDVLLEEGAIKRCKRQKCQRPFIRMRDPERSKRGRASGVFYCSIRCKNAQAQADREKRRKAKAADGQAATN